MLTDEQDAFLRDIYFDISKAGSYIGADAFYRAVKKIGKYDISKAQIARWLSKFPAYSQTKEVKRNLKKTPRVISTYKAYSQQSDTANMKFLSKYNNGYNYFIVLINPLTRYLQAEKLKTLKTSEVRKAMEKMFQNTEKPYMLYTDSGTEYLGTVSDYLKEQNIKHVKALTQKKAFLAERIILYIKKILSRYFKHNHTYRWAEIFDKVVSNYNNTVTSALGITPEEARNTPDAVLWKLHEKHRRGKTQRPSQSTRVKSPYKYNIGDTVRLATIPTKFTRIYDDTYTPERFVIYWRGLKQGFDVYHVKDLDNKKIDGFIRSNELQRVPNETENQTYKIDKILKTRIKNGKKQFLVSWVGFSSKYNSFVNEEDIVDIS